MPSTPTYPKVVHFDQQLEHVRHFSRSEKPTAVSAGSSPVECYELESEFPFGEPARKQPFVWDINLPNFPVEPALSARKSLPVYVERVYLSADEQGLMGSIAVANIAFHKSVVVRFTLDYWRTTSEVSAEYNSDVRKKQSNDGYDRFNFCIRLDNVADLNNQTLFFCVRYSANGQDYWDNNNAMNFQVDFSKKMKDSGAQTANPTAKNILPRSKPSPRKISMENESDDEFALAIKKPSFDRPKMPPKSISQDSTTSLPIRRPNSQNAFASRYSFGASWNESREPTVARDENRGGRLRLQTPLSSRPQAQPSPPQHTLPVSKVTPQKPVSAIPRMNSNEKPPIESATYLELLNNYCFFGSEKTSPQASPQSSFTDLASMREPSQKDQQSFMNSASGYLSPQFVGNSPAFELAGQSAFRWSPSGSPPSLSGSPLSSVASTPINYTGPYNYQRRRHGGGLGGFAFEASPSTAIRG